MAEEWQKRILPNSTDAEKSVIGSMLMDRDAITTASEILTGDDFYVKQNQILFETMVELHNEGKPVDLVTLQNRLKEKDIPPEITAMEFVRELLEATPTSANVKYYANIVAEKATLRKLIKATEGVENDCYNQKDSVDTIMDEAEKNIFKVLQRRNAGDYVPISTVVNNALDKISLAARNKGAVTGIPTGFIDLDFKTAGLQPSDLVLIAARPSMGKTAFVLNIAQHVAFKQGLPTAIFSLEMSKEQLVNRLFSLQSGVDAQKLRTGNLDESDWEMLIEGATDIGQSKLIIDDTPGISIGELRSKCRRYKLEHGLSIIMIDYLQLMTGSGKNAESRQQEISEISRSLKGLARELQVPVIALSQLSRAVESRPDKRPMLSDLRESGAIEQDADVVMFIYRDDYYNHESPDKGISEIIIAKQRNGPIGTVKLAWLPELTKFANLARDNDRFNQE
ncbi:primary replicative DNA helicase [Lachnospiraceae bacterium YSD2013]|nr:replicative DNA helicase [Lachnospiraceae bacterium]SCX11347.1 primary replicative DNA helicase [Lachnospiraceae bacterium YSD2013]MBO4824167.1 replicative DNA helicase [Lachnospiraceae bacterium]MBR5762073.1 replicative DNA helicase [Lachnospiraceae bacterium]MBR5992977.1 replicative DNA helicase [Lachnospiraceae bacterium]